MPFLDYDPECFRLLLAYLRCGCVKGERRDGRQGPALVPSCPSAQPLTTTPHILQSRRQRRLAGPDVPVPPPTVPRSLSGAWALFVDYLGVGEFLAAGALVEGVEQLPPPSAVAMAAATAAAAAPGEEEEDEEEGEMGGMHVPGFPLGTTMWLGGASMHHHHQENGGGQPRCSVAPLVFDVVSKGTGWREGCVICGHVDGWIDQVRTTDGWRIWMDGQE